MAGAIGRGAHGVLRVEGSHRLATYAEAAAYQSAFDHSETWRQKRARALREIEQIEAATADRAARVLVHGRSSDAEIRAVADRRAGLLGQLIDGIDRTYTPAGLLAWLCGLVEPLQARPFRFEGDRPEPDQLRGFMARARCSLWWRRQLRRAAVRHRETEANVTGEVCATRRQPYVTNDTAARHAQRRADTAAMMAATELENEAGQVMSLAQLAATTTSNPAIRRGELMTRITGCERLAEAFGARGVFLTMTAPSRFHRVHRHGGGNDKHDGSTPRDAHEWLCGTWAKARAALARRGLAPFGFRVAEPHHDGCPHWHALLWVKPGQLWRLVRVLKRWWLADAGDEAGARQHRVKAVLMRPGGASGYIAKYVAKNIDDAGAIGAEGHTDDDYTDAVPKPAQADAFGGTAQRVAAWAGAWGIRQFQAIGQPPVTVWRELRRVPGQAQAGASQRMAQAFEAVNRAGERRADWALYVIAQGGLHLGRRYLLRLATATRTVHGRYETTDEARPVGVVDSTGRGDWHTSERREWRPRGDWGSREARAVPPWTRVNNCTQPPTMVAGRFVDFGGIIRRAARSGPHSVNPGEGLQPEGQPPCVLSRSSRPKSRPS